MPYLRRIDAARIYANWGPLSAELEVRLAVHCGGHVVSVSTATDGLVCALRAVLEDRPSEARQGLCLMPSWSFVASGHAAIAADLHPAFLDVGEERWALDPDQVRNAIRSARASQEGVAVAAVMVVAPFGLLVDPGPWDAFTQETGIPVVIDAAAAFDGLSAGRPPAVVSMHATKVVGAGEGGFVATTDPDLARRIKRAANLGFFGSRTAEVSGLNAKLSEYHAAVALAALDEWPERRAALITTAARMSDALTGMGRGLLPGFGKDWVASTCVVRLPAGVGAAEAALDLGLFGIQTRSWWGEGNHAQPAFRDFATFPAGVRLEVTRRLAQTTLGLPFLPDMNEEEIERVLGAMRQICLQAQPRKAS
ncbi:DegT/DnrJ/EryC1/StrS family aminotransferase [Sabulicella rubraurantiaca]|uniref:DegT/DnrJ/EryC1/StrS family aminotransferase n=1 Tax=Sabulicella rubraurantiaca TaxID=2811429 RepID=UPI001F234373|nr:DegT/DnrJ/EryC1/StrS family aminotransferase [Sabulicella rubraurantiaca]